MNQNKQRQIQNKYHQRGENTSDEDECHIRNAELQFAELYNLFGNNQCRYADLKSREEP